MDLLVSSDEVADWKQLIIPPLTLLSKRVEEHIVAVKLV